MSAAGDRRGVPLGPQAVAVRKLEIHPNHSVDVKEGSPVGPPFTHHIQIVLAGDGLAILLPVTAPFLRALGRQCNQHGDPSPSPRPKEGMQ